VARLFVTMRRCLRSGDIEEVVLGVDLSPTFLLPPYTLWCFGERPPGEACVLLSCSNGALMVDSRFR
jgi:hypothetical protein